MDVDLSTFEREVGEGVPGLARAALLYAREIAYPKLRPSEYMVRLDAWAEQARAALTIPASEEARVEAVQVALFRLQGVRGDLNNYYDARNSFLNEVMDRKLGLPITMTVLFLELCERLGVRAEGVGLPGHFVAAVYTEKGRRLVDPFHGGLPLSLEEAGRLVMLSTGRTAPLREEWLAPMPAKGILARMLGNLRRVYVEQESWTRLVAVLERLLLLQPGTAEHIRDLGLAHFQNHSFRQAASCLEEYLTRFPGSADAPAVRSRLTFAMDQVSRMN